MDTPSSAVRASPETASSNRHQHQHQATISDQQHNSADNFENSLRSGNKYNQEKALNLKLEYGFRPLPPTHSKTTTTSNDDAEGFRTKDFTVTNSIQTNTGEPFVDFAKDSLSSAEDDGLGSLKQTSNGHKNDEDAENGDSLGGSGNNIYSSLTAAKISTSNDDDDDDDAESERMRSMKSLAFEALNNHNHQQQHLDPADYKKYISYPMETESSDIHKLAFTGVESFHKPEHGSYADHDLGLESTVSNGGDSLAGYPHLKNFKTQGIDCARNAGYCEYDSSYPK